MEKQSNIEDLKDSKISELSGGQRQRVMIAKALVNEPQILILDEPNTGVDKQSQINFYTLLKSLNEQENITILFITHDLEEALRLGDRIALMKDGAVVQIGTPQEIIENPADAFRFSVTCGDGKGWIGSFLQAIGSFVAGG